MDKLTKSRPTSWF